MKRSLVAWLVAAAATAVVSSLGAQAPAKSLCFRGRPPDRCRWFFITESRYHYRLTPGTTRDQRGDPGTSFLRHYLLAEAGLMRNVSPDWAVGVTLWGGHDFGFETARFGMAARARRWLAGSALEASLGPAYTSKTVGKGITAALGAAARIDWNVRDVVNLGLRAEWVPEGRACPPQFVTEFSCEEVVWTSPTTGRAIDRTESVRVWRVYAAAGVGSKPAVITWLGAGVLGLLAAGMSGCCGL
jgi:hypothetical protein